MNFFVLTVTDESDMLADSCGREGRLAEQEAAMHKARRRLRAVGKRRQTTFWFHTAKTTRDETARLKRVCDGHSCWGSLRTGVHFGQTCLLSL
jgi:hypothetical protein